MVSIKELQSKKQNGEKIAMLTCYDSTFAKLMANEGIDTLLVGDSLGMVLQGSQDTLSVTLEDMVYHTRCVASGAPDSFIISDMPVGTYEHDPHTALLNAQQLINAGANMVKLEGAGDRINVVRHLVAHHVPVCGHLGFTPQSVIELGGYKIQGKTEESARQILQDAIALTSAGIQMLVLEMVPSSLAKIITERLSIITIGIGAGVHCDGQVLVLQDLLGIYNGPASTEPATFKRPRFVKNFLAESNSIQEAVASYIRDVKSGAFPAIEHSY